MLEAYVCLTLIVVAVVVTTLITLVTGKVVFNRTIKRLEVTVKKMKEELNAG